MNYISIYSNLKNKGSEAILNTANDCFVPESFVKLTKKEIEDLGELSYGERIAYFLHLFFPEFNYNFLLETCNKACSNFPLGDSAQLVEINEDEFFLELYHGIGLNANDVWAGILPALVKEAASISGIENLRFIIVGTEKTASYLADDYTKKNACFLRDRKTATEALNELIKISGKDAQIIETEKITDEKLMELKSTLSDNCDVTPVIIDDTNIATVIIKTALIVSAYSDLVAAEAIKNGDKLNFAIPVQCFSDITSCIYAKMLGVPIEKIICAVDGNSNAEDLLKTGNCYNAYSKNAALPLLINELTPDVNAFIFEITNRSTSRTQKIFDNAKNKAYSIDGYTFLSNSFFVSSSSKNDIYDFISEYFEEYGYLMDPKTASAVCSAADYSNATGDMTPVVYLSPSSPYIYPAEVYYAITEKKCTNLSLAAKKLFEESGMDIPDFLTK